MLFASLALDRLKESFPAASQPSQLEPQRELGSSLPSQSQAVPQRELSSNSSQGYNTLIKGAKFDLIEDNDILKNFIAPLDNYRLSSGNVLRGVPAGTRAINLVGNKQLNTGADLAVPVGTPFKSMQQGEVIEAKTGDNGGYGNYVLLKHNIGGKEVFTRYAHLSNFDVKAGDIVKQGQILGKTGNSGNTTGSGHVDVEAFIKGEKGKKLFIKTDNLYK